MPKGPDQCSLVRNWRSHSFPHGSSMSPDDIIKKFHHSLLPPALNVTLKFLWSFQREPGMNWVPLCIYGGSFQKPSEVGSVIVLGIEEPEDLKGVMRRQGHLTSKWQKWVTLWNNTARGSHFHFFELKIQFFLYRYRQISGHSAHVYQHMGKLYLS